MSSNLVGRTIFSSLIELNKSYFRQLVQIFHFTAVYSVLPLLMTNNNKKKTFFEGRI